MMRQELNASTNSSLFFLYNCTKMSAQISPACNTTFEAAASWQSCSFSVQSQGLAVAAQHGSHFTLRVRRWDKKQRTLLLHMQHASGGTGSFSDVFCTSLRTRGVCSHHVALLHLSTGSWCWSGGWQPYLWQGAGTQWSLRSLPT